MFHRLNYLALRKGLPLRETHSSTFIMSRRPGMQQWLVLLKHRVFTRCPVYAGGGAACLL